MQGCADGNKRGYTTTLLKRRIASMDTNSPASIGGASPFISGREIPDRMFLIPIHIDILLLSLQSETCVQVDPKAIWIFQKFGQTTNDMVSVGYHSHRDTLDSQWIVGSHNVYSTIAKMRGHKALSLHEWQKLVVDYVHMILRTEQVDSTSRQISA
jgi:hypothetical protein